MAGLGQFWRFRQNPEIGHFGLFWHSSEKGTFERSERIEVSGHLWPAEGRKTYEIRRVDFGLPGEYLPELSRDGRCRSFSDAQQEHPEAHLPTLKVANLRRHRR